MTARWNYAAALERVGGDEELLHELILVFFDEYPKLAGQLKQALSVQDLVSLRQAAHSLKGSLGYIGATAAEKMALQIEHASLAGDAARAEECVTALMSEIESLRPAMLSHAGD